MAQGVTFLTAVPAALQPGNAASAGVSPFPSRADHVHAITGGSGPPSAHAATHRQGSTDPVQLTQAQVDGLPAALAAAASTASVAAAVAAEASLRSAADLAEAGARVAGDLLNVKRSWFLA